jgi:8-oxo-dGTP diphosphatase
MTVYLIRHASAGDRGEWQGDDRLRPLDKKGRKQAQRLVDELSSYEIERIFSSPYKRCVETVEPLARARELAIELRNELGESEVDAGARLVRSVLDEKAAVCGHAGLSDEVAGASQKKAEAFVLDESGRIVDRFRP